MRVGERGRVTIPKDIRDRFGLGPDVDVEFRVVNGTIVLEKAPTKLELWKWKGRCKESFAELGYSSVDKFVDGVRGR
jgi:AbrB family looped-hinge helix DNA binding protein